MFQSDVCVSFQQQLQLLVTLTQISNNKHNYNTIITSLSIQDIAMSMPLKTSGKMDDESVDVDCAEDSVTRDDHVNL